MGKITTDSELRQLYKQPVERVIKKVLRRLDKHCRRYIELSPYLTMATMGDDGLADVSPRGDQPGFVKIIDDVTLAIPDRPGNNRLDTMTNILMNPGVGLLFMIPGVDEILRINGTAEIRDDEDLLAAFEVNGRLPVSVIVIDVREVYLHCAKALIRSRLWDAGSQIDRSLLPTMNEMLKDHTGDPAEPESQEVMLARYQKVLY